MAELSDFKDGGASTVRVADPPPLVSRETTFSTVEKRRLGTHNGVHPVVRGAPCRLVSASPVPTGEQLVEQHLEHTCPLCEGEKRILRRGRGHMKHPPIAPVICPACADSFEPGGHRDESGAWHPCATCGGASELPGEPDPESRTCHHCKGTGVVVTHVPAQTEADQSFQVEILESRPGYPAGTRLWAKRHELE